MPNFPRNGALAQGRGFRLPARRGAAIAGKNRMEIRCAGASTMQFRRVGNHPFFHLLPVSPTPLSFAAFSLSPRPGSRHVPPSLPGRLSSSSLAGPRLGPSLPDAYARARAKVCQKPFCSDRKNGTHCLLTCESALMAKVCEIIVNRDYIRENNAGGYVLRARRRCLRPSAYVSTRPRPSTSVQQTC